MQQKTHITDKINQLLGNKRLNNKELDEATAFLDSFKNNNDVDEWLRANWNNANTNQTNKRISFDAIDKKIKGLNKRKRMIQLLSAAAAAAIIISLMVSAWLFVYNSPTHTQSQLASSNPTQKVQDKKVILETSGKAFDLSDNEIDVINNNLAIKGSNEKLSLSKLNNNTSNQLEQTWSTLSIPRGKDYFVELPDGTEVWLNAGSKLSFPDFFANNVRKVELEGEAFFKVESDLTRPFYVATAGQTVKVTGTQFNVCAYADEPKSHVTLAEGKVSVIINDKEHQLLPGEQLQQLKDGTISKQEVDVYLYTSWREGIFEFSNMPLQDISYRLSKWYDVEFEFESHSSANQRFTGMTKKEYSLDYFLRVIEKTTNVKFNKSNKQITVSES